MEGKSIIFFDIDGTLLNENKELPPLTKKAILQLKEAGHKVAIATGRAPFMFENLRKQLEIDTFVSYNGQFVVLNGEVIYTNALEKDSLKRLTDVALENDHPIVYMDHEDMKANVPEHRYINESIDSLKIDQFPTHDPQYFKDRNLYQMLLFCTEGEESQYESQFEEFDFIRWHPLSVDVLPDGGSKAKGIQKIVDELGIPKHRQYAFGDGLNDIEMLSVIENSVAMGNGEEQTKKVARYITKSVEEDGIMYGLKKLGLL